ncbi:hypothetical protein KBC54_00240 [Patescibacteria group bacterium]|nr:hypothetical protein [Patescibacteria group bacterium]
MLQALKKVFSVFVTLTTIAWSVGVGSLALPSVASAATLSGGDLIKASGPAVYFYAADGKRYVFPNEKTYMSWYADFSSVKTITDAELAAVQIGGNVTLRSGTKLVKITTDPKTYAVTPGGVLHWIESEAVAKALYGNAWASRVVDVADGFFVNYTVGSSVSTNVHPDGSLIQYAGDSSVYVVMGGMKRKFSSDAAFAANGLNKANVITTTLSYGNGSDVAGRESVLADTVSAGAGPVVGGALSVALASDTPAGMTVPKNSSGVQLTKVNLTAGSASVVVTGVRFHRVGVGAVSDFANVYLYDANGKRLTTGRTVNAATNVVEFNGLNQTIAAGQTLSLVVYGDIYTTTTGGQHSFELVDAASVVVSGNSTVSGAFPVRGNVFTVGTSSAARVDIQKGTTPANPTIGSKQVEISNFKLVANTNDVDVKQVTLYQAGSVTNSDLTNFNLYQGATLVATAASVDANGRITLKFSPSYMIANGTTKNFSLKADVGGRASRTIRTYVEYTTDLIAMDRVYGAGAQTCIISTATGCSGGSANFDGTSTNYVEVTTQGGQLTNAFNGPATTNIAKGQLGVPLYKFALSSPDNTLEVRKMVFTITKTAGTGCTVVGAGGVDYFRSIKVKNLDTGTTVMGPLEMSAADSATTATLTFTDSFNISAGQSMNLALVSDLYSGSDDGAAYFSSTGLCEYKAAFAAFGSSDVRVVDTGEFLATSKIVPNTDVTGNALTVKTSSLTVSLASNPVSGTVVKKQADVPVAGLVLAASAQSDITVTSLTLAGQADLVTSGCNSEDFGGAACNLTNFDDRVTSLALFDGATQVGLAKSPDATTGKAQISNMNLVIPKGTSKTLTVKATLSSTASSTADYDQIAVGIAEAADVSAQDQDSNTVTASLDAAVTAQATGAAPSVIQTVRANGSLTIAPDAHPASNIVVAGKDAWIPMAQYKATAQYEAISLDRIALQTASATAGLMSDNADFAGVAIAMNGAVKAEGLFSSGATGTKDLDLSANPITVPKDSSVTFQVWAKLSAVQASSSVSGANTGVSRSGHVPAVDLMSGLQTGEWSSSYASMENIRATGLASGERLYAAAVSSAGNVMVLRKSMPIVTKQSLSSATLSNTDQDLIKWQIAADSAGSIAWKQAIFQVTKSAGVTLSNFRLRRGGTDMDTSLYTITNGTSTDNLITGSIATGDAQAVFVVVAMAAGQEESISGSGNVYTLHATVSGATSGKSVTTSFYRDNTNPVVTGYLATGAYNALTATANVFNIDTAAAPSGGTGSATGTFVWSDFSEVPHSPVAQTGSRDWTNDLYVQDLSQSQTLSL